MKRQIVLVCALQLGAIALSMLPSDLAAQALRYAPGFGWHLMGSHPEHYEVGPTDGDRDLTVPGSVVTLVSRSSEAEGFGTYAHMQRVTSLHRGQRVRLSVNIRSEDVEQWAGLWMRVDGSDRQSLAFDNMVDRPVRGTTDWQRYSVVLDVAEDARRLAYGILLGGAGRVWIEHLTLEIVDRSVPLTGVRNRERAATGGDHPTSWSGSRPEAESVVVLSSASGNAVSVARR